MSFFAETRTRLAAANELGEEQSREARLMMIIANSLGTFLALTTVLAAVVWVIRNGLGPIGALAPNPDANIRWWQAPILALTAVFLLQAGQLARAGRVRLAAWTIVVVLDVLLVVQALLLDVAVTFVMGFVIPSLLTAVVLNARSTILHGIAAFIVGGALLRGTGVTSPELPTTLGMLVSVLSIAIVVGLVREHDVAEVNTLRAAEQTEAERIQGELRLARRVQLAMHPSDFPEIAGAEIAAFSEPAFEASGDFYDVFTVVDPSSGETHVAMCVCDVAGKGVASALVMSATRASLRSAATRTYSPASVLVEVNATLAASIPPELFVTASYAIFDPGERSILHAGAGHPHPLLWDATTGEVSELESFGMPLGLIADAEYTNCLTTLEPGNAVALYSDGLPEALNADREFYGFDRVAQDFAAAASASDSAEAQLEQLLTSLRAFVGDSPFDDDVTAVVLS